MKKLLLLISILLLSVISISAGQVSLDHTEGTWFNGVKDKIIPGSPVEFHLRLTNDDGQIITSLSNGFRINGFTGPHTPLTGYSLIEPEYFTFSIYTGSDIVGFNSLFGSLPIGFDDIGYVLQTGNFIEGDLVCLDSSFFSFSGIWIWSTASSTIMPSWDGPHCFSVETPCYPPTFDNCPDSLVLNRCNYSYDFQATDDNVGNGSLRFSLVDGPGAIDNISGIWSYTPTDLDYGTTQNLTVKTYKYQCPSNFSLCSTTLIFIDSYVPADITYDCTVDIADLVYLAFYMFLDGPAPEYITSADMNGDSEINISDLVYLVAYMFQGGPPPIS